MLGPHDSERFKAAERATHLLSRRRNNVTGPLSACDDSPFLTGCELPQAVRSQEEC